MNKIETIKYNGTIVPKFQAEGNAMRWVRPYAEYLIKGVGVEIGVNRIDWMAFGDTYNDFIDYVTLKGTDSFELNSEYVFTYFLKHIDGFYDKNDKCSFPIDPTLDVRFNATNFPIDCHQLDYIINSHILEHVPNVVETLEYWKSALKEDGILFTYLPSYKSEYWKIQNNRKHLHEFRPKQFNKLLVDLGFKNVFVSGTDLNNSFLAICNK